MSKIKQNKALAPNTARPPIWRDGTHLVEFGPGQTRSVLCRFKINAYAQLGYVVYITMPSEEKIPLKHVARLVFRTIYRVEANDGRHHTREALQNMAEKILLTVRDLTSPGIYAKVVER